MSKLILMLDIYADIILDHYKNPHNFGTIKEPDASAIDVNPLCGDEIEMHLKVGDSKIFDIKFTGRGCAISQASASMLTELAIGKTLEEIKRMERKDIIDLLGIELSHARIKCAMLSLKVLKLAVYKYLGGKMSEEEESL